VRRLGRLCVSEKADFAEALALTVEWPERETGALLSTVTGFDYDYCTVRQDLG